MAEYCRGGEWNPPSPAGQNAATETEKTPGREILRVTLLNGSNDDVRDSRAVVADLVNPIDDEKNFQDAALLIQ